MRVCEFGEVPKLKNIDMDMKCRIKYMKFKERLIDN